MTLNLPISRPATSSLASLVAFVLCLLLCAQVAADAVELPSELQADSILRLEQPIERSDQLDAIYEPEFAAFDRSIIGRAPDGITALSNNAPDSRNLEPGKAIYYMVEKNTLDAGIDARDYKDDESTEAEGDSHQHSRRAKARTVYISANTCLVPKIVAKDDEPKKVPQLVLYVSTTNETQRPDSSNFKEGNSKLKRIPFEEGAVMYSVNATDDIYLSVAAPNATREGEDPWNFQITISLDEYYHSYDSDNTTSQLLWMDSDSTSVLLVSKNLTSNQDSREIQKIMKAPPPYEIFVGAKSGAIEGLRHSVCGLQLQAQIWANSDGPGRFSNLVTTGMTMRGPGQLPKQQFLLTGLNASTAYSGILVQKARGKSKRQSAGDSVGGGGIVFRATEFETLSGTNCKVVTDLEFCNETQYAVPGNDKGFNNTELAKVYDDYARDMYANFEKVLAQIACEVPPESAYSLTRNCNDCREAYKRWLCTVSIPRCVDFMSSSKYGIERNAFQAFPNGTKLPDELRKDFINKPSNNASRNAWIDTKIKPGPYKEILPCEDICYDVVQSCPAAIGFACPLPGYPSFNVSYGRRDNSMAVTCNYPGEARTKISAAGTVLPSAVLLGIVPLMIWLGL
ncbi:hypothetical protein ACJ41O_013664 [Fusarium nematophilum]